MSLSYAFLETEEKKWKIINFRQFHPIYSAYRNGFITWLKNKTEYGMISSVTFHMTILYMDIYFESKLNQNFKYNLFCIFYVCYYISLKLEDQDGNLPFNLNALNFEFNTNITIFDIKTIELHICSFFKWDLYMTTVIHFIYSYYPYIYEYSDKIITHKDEEMFFEISLTDSFINENKNIIDERQLRKRIILPNQAFSLETIPDTPTSPNENFIYDNNNFDRQSENYQNNFSKQNCVSGKERPFEDIYDFDINKIPPQQKLNMKIIFEYVELFSHLCLGNTYFLTKKHSLLALGYIYCARKILNYQPILTSSLENISPYSIKEIYQIGNEIWEYLKTHYEIKIHNI